MIIGKSLLSFVGAVALLTCPSVVAFGQRTVQLPRVGLLAVDDAFQPGETEAVEVELVFNETGELVESRVLEGRDDLRRRAIQIALADELDVQAERVRVQVRFASPEDADMYPSLYIEPKYPPFARTARQTGDVMLEAVIDPGGRVSRVSVTDGPPLLRSAAVDAVRQWRYEPYVLNGVPVSVVTPIRVRFSLRDRE